MKEPFSMETGRVVQSLQGRDKGDFFLVLEARGDGFVMMADGLTRKLEHPKKKKTKHLCAKPVLIDFSTLRPEGGKIQNSDLRKALESHGFAGKRSLCKESRALCERSRVSHTAHEKEG